MARTARPRSDGREKLPLPLPPETRTVGQLVAEAVRAYARRFWPSLALGVGPAAVGIALALVPGRGQLFFVLSVGSLVLTASYIGATVLVSDVRPSAESVVTALAAGLLAFLPAPFLYSLFILPAVAWLAFVGLAVPVAIVERLGLRDCFARAVQLARADFVHATGSLATLTIIGLLTSLVLFFLLRGQGEATLATAAFLSVLVISPVLFLGAALLYFDQAARAVSSPSGATRRRRNADVHHAEHTDGPGRSDAEVEPGATPRGEP